MKRRGMVQQQQQPEVMDLTESNLDNDAAVIAKAVQIQKILLAMNPAELIGISCQRFGGLGYCNRHDTKSSKLPVSVLHRKTVPFFDFMSYFICIPCLKTYLENKPADAPEVPAIQVKQRCDDELMIATIEHSAPHDISTPDEKLKLIYELVKKNLVNKFLQQYPIQETPEILALMQKDAVLSDTQMDGLMAQLTSLFISKIGLIGAYNGFVFCESSLVILLLGLKPNPQNPNDQGAVLVPNPDTEKINRAMDKFGQRINNKFIVNKRPRTIIMPYIKGFHWTLFVLTESKDGTGGTIGFFNSKKMTNYLTSLEEVERIKLLIDKIKLGGGSAKWKYEKISHPVQGETDTISCGYFVIFQILLCCFPNDFFEPFEVGSVIDQPILLVKAILMFMKIYNRFPLQLLPM